MANHERGEVDLVARNKTYTLALTTNGACALEAASGRPLALIVKGALHYSLVDMRWMVWGALQEHHRDEIQTPEEAGRFIDDAGGLATVWTALNTFQQANADPRPAQTREAGPSSSDPPIAQVAASGNGSTSMPVVSA
jgi:hypothetical protein